MTEILPLELTIKHVRAVNSATIPLSGLTVLCGDNSTGKTTIANVLKETVETILYARGFYRLYLFGKFNRTILAPLLDAVNLSDSDFRGNDLFRILQGSDIKDLDVEPMLNRLRALKEKVESIFQSDSWKTFNPSSRFSGYLLNALRITPQTSVPEIEQAVRMELEKIENEIQSSPKLPLSMDNLRKCSAVYNLWNVWNGVVELKERDDVVLSYEGKEFRSEGSRFASVDKVLFLQSPFESRARGYRQKDIVVDIDSCLLTVPDHALPFRFENAHESQNVKDIDRLFVELIGGRIWKDEKSSDRQFVHDDWQFVRDDGMPFPLQECASGIRSLSALMRLYAYGLIDEKTILVLDEPEVHLHPKWIVGYARVLVELVRRKHVRVLLASHSPDMVYALQSFAFEAGIAKQTHFCQAQRSREDEYAYDFIDRGHNIGTVFDSFNEVNELIESFSAKIKDGE